MGRLRECPLCGGVAIPTERYENIDSTTTVITCTNCGLTLKWEQHYAYSEKRSVAGELLEHKRVNLNISAEEAWNRRADNV